MPPTDWTEVFSFSVAPLELFVRGTVTYFFLFALFRFVVRRDTGGLGISDLLVLVIVADAAQNAMAGDYKSVPDGMVLIGTIIGWSLVLNYLSLVFPAVRRIVLPRPLCLIKDGVKQARNLRREMISDEELDEMLREHEVTRVEEVRRAYLEPDGQVTVERFRRQEGPAHAGRKRVP